MIRDASQIWQETLAQVRPDKGVGEALEKLSFAGDIRVVAVGKAAWQMAMAAQKTLGEKIREGVVITKYHHVQGDIPGFTCYEAGHPVPDENTFSATRKALELTEGLTEKDTVLLLLSGGGSALFEDPAVEVCQLQAVTQQLLASGADIQEINTIRKRLSRVKGGRFAVHCAPAKVCAIVLSDVLGDRLDMIASGPACADASTCREAMAVVEKYGLQLPEQVRAQLEKETPKVITNAQHHIVGSVGQLCQAAADRCRALGYEPILLTDRMNGFARQTGQALGALALEYVGKGKKVALLSGGETVVKLTGTGKGGRNQELALAACRGIAGVEQVAIFSIGSDGTDGPTDAAGGFVDGNTLSRLAEQGLTPEEFLDNNDAYHGLLAAGGLIVTGPTGTNVNDIAVALISG